MERRIDLLQWWKGGAFHLLKTVCVGGWEGAWWGA